MAAPEQTATAAGTDRWSVVGSIIAVVAIGAAAAAAPDLLAGLVVLALGTAFAVAAYRRPEVGAVALAVLVWSDVSAIAEVRLGIPSVLQSLTLLLIAVLVVRFARGFPGTPGLGAVVVLLGAYGAAQAASAITARDVAGVLSTVDGYARAAVIAVVVVMFTTSLNRLRHVVWGLVLTGLTLSAVNVLQFVTGTFDRTYFGLADARLVQIAGSVDAHRITGPLGDPNFFAQMMAVVVPLAAYRALHETWLPARLVACVAMLSCTAAVVLSYSRGGLFTLAVLVALFVLLHPTRQALIGMGVLITAVLGVLASMSPAVLERLAAVQGVVTLAAGGATDPSLRGRVSEAVVAWHMLLDNPVLGIGAGRYPEEYQRYNRVLGMDPRVTDREAHSLYLEVAAETGIVGLLGFGILLAVAVVGAASARGRLEHVGLTDHAALVESLLMALVAYLTTAIFLHGWLLRLLLLLLALTVATAPLARQELRRRRLNPR